MTFNTEVTGCHWEQNNGEWRVTPRQTTPDGCTKEFEERSHMLLQATGALNKFKWPKIDSIKKFKGRVCRSCEQFPF